MTTSSTYLPPITQEDRWTPPPRYNFLLTTGLASAIASLALAAYTFHLLTTTTDRAFIAFTLVAIQLPLLALQSALHAVPSILFLTRHSPPSTPALTLSLLAWLPPILTLSALACTLANLLST